MLGSEPFVKEARICKKRICWCEINQVGAGVKDNLPILYPCTYAVHVNGVPKGHLLVPGSTCFQDLGGLSMINFVPFLLRADEESVDFVFEQKLVPVMAMAIFCLVGSFKTVQSRL